MGLPLCELLNVPARTRRVPHHDSYTAVPVPIYLKRPRTLNVGGLRVLFRRDIPSSWLVPIRTRIRHDLDVDDHRYVP